MKRSSLPFLSPLHRSQSVLLPLVLAITGVVVVWTIPAFATEPTQSASATPAATAAASPADAQSKEDIIVGQLGSFSGDKATFGASLLNSMAMAAEEINQSGGLLGGRQIRYVLEDDQSKAGQPAALVRKVISNNHAVAIIGEFVSSLALEAAPICDALQVPMITPGATNPMLTQKSTYVFRDNFNDNFQGEVMAKFALETLKLKNVAVITAVNQDYSIGLAQAFIKYFKAHGGTIIAEKSYSSGDKDFRAQLTAMKSLKPEAIFVPSYYVDGGLIARQARSLGIQIPLLGGDGWDSPLLSQIAGSSMEGNYFTTHFSADDDHPLIQKFVKKYTDRFHRLPDSFSSLGYDAVYILADAIQRAGTTDEPALRNAIAETKNFNGITGTITIDENRNAIKPAVIVQFREGKPRFVARVMP